MFVHFNIGHLILNMLFLFTFGIRAETLFSIKEYILVYFASGISGNLLTLLLGPDVISAGASGAIFGLFGACVIYLRKTLKQSIMGAIIYSLFLLIMSGGRGVNIAAHAGGLAAGLSIGYAIAERHT